ncbi:MAG: DUF3048 domain-containing protein [Ruminococcaceae bacterium]|nr:DUF3048 domain-containing protein [Oscillospiraceae bacterium]
MLRKFLAQSRVTVVLLLVLASLLTACGGGEPAVTTTATPAATTGTTTTAATTTAATTTPATTTVPPTTLPTGTLSQNTAVIVTQTTTPPETTTVVTTPEPVPSNVNFLTGLPLEDLSVNQARPVAIVFNNLRIALPQHGIAAADIVFEVEAEGGITRLVAVYSDIASAGTIGSVRSARPVMINLAMGLDCVFVHSGGSPQAYTDLKKYGVTDIDGLYDPGIVFYRDSLRESSMGYEHALMTTGTRLENQLNKFASSGKRVTLKDGYTAPFAFYDASTVPNGATAAAKVTTKYGSYQPFFRYDEASGNYQRYQYGARHIDNNGGEQLSFKNVIVLSVPSHVISGDTAGRRQFSDVGSGIGIYATNGVSIPIQWSKASASAPLVLTTASGETLKLNPGKTFISYVNGENNIVVGN